VSGLTGYRAGLSAEAAVEVHYARAGHTIAARRWRGRAGEIDLILRDGDGFIFVEVKKSRDFAAAAARLSPRQMQRICLAAQEFLADAPRGLDTPMRLDVALVDAVGRVEVIENAFGA
jgi:putative endonuclease